MLIALLRAHKNHRALLFLYNFLKKILSLLSFLRMSQSSDPQQQQEQSSVIDSSSFDPSKPSPPISYPIKTLDELESRAYFNSFHYPFNKSSVTLQRAFSLPNRPRLLVCHDLQGGYGDDKWVQGGTNPDAYAIWHWYLIDVFVYFSHYLVTLPPPCWTNAAHRHGVKVLGTFITEWDEGKIVCNKLFATKESARMYAERLVELAVDLGFDGWLINMEVNLDEGQMPNLKEFVSHLTQMMHSSMPGSLVIWYDSVTVDGQLKWQNQLNERNKPFFDICDGIFVNYTWRREYPKLSAVVADDRKFDIYMGIDVFGRNTYGGGQWNANLALNVLKEDDVSAAIFAPGWVYETKQLPDFWTAQNRWWALVEKSWGRVNKYPKILPFYSNFDQGQGYHVSVEGEQVTNASWNNISCQGFQPCLEFVDAPTPDTIQAFVDFKETSYNGGGNITFRGTLEDNVYFTTRLFQGELLLGNLPLHITYSAKSGGDSLLGLCLQFSSTTNERTSVLVACWEINQPCSKFNKVIVPHQVGMSETVPGWVIYEGSIAMDGHILTEIHAVCYRTNHICSDFGSEYKTNSKDNALLHSSAEYLAVLGHITIKNSKGNSLFPPSTSWLVEGQYIKCISDSHGYKTVSMKIIWKLKDRDDLVFPKYNIYVYVERKEDGNLGGTMQYIGVAQVQAFYISEFSFPSDTYRLKFIIQACGVDGTCQKLAAAPYFQLEIEGQ